MTSLKNQLLPWDVSRFLSDNAESPLMWTVMLANEPASRGPNELKAQFNQAVSDCTPSTSTVNEVSGENATLRKAYWPSRPSQLQKFRLGSAYSLTGLRWHGDREPHICGHGLSRVLRRVAWGGLNNPSGAPRNPHAAFGKEDIGETRFSGGDSEATSATSASSVISTIKNGTVTNFPLRAAENPAIQRHHAVCATNA